MRDHIISEDGGMQSSPAAVERARLGEIQVSWGPDIVCLAFALELYMKALILEDTKQPAAGRHQLQKLWDQLSSRHAALIKSASTHPYFDPATLDADLAKINHSFEIWRYHYEQTNVWFPPAQMYALAKAFRAAFAAIASPIDPL